MPLLRYLLLMMTSSNGSIFRVTGLLCGHRWIPRTKASDTELWYFLWSAPEQKTNSRNAGDLRRHRGHYDVTVMCFQGAPGGPPLSCSRLEPSELLRWPVRQVLWSPQGLLKLLDELPTHTDQYRTRNGADALLQGLPETSREDA